MPLVSSAGEHLHAHRVARGHVGLEERIDARAHRLPVSRRNSTHADVATRITTRAEARNPSRSPSQPEPSHATGVVDFQRFGSQRAQCKFTAARFELRW